MDFAVRFIDVHKEYPFYQHITAGVKSFLFNLPRNLSALRRTRFEALKGVSFEVRKGETFGIIGRNGSGKSTILSLIADVIRQDAGRIEINGRISSLLELGAGFHPDLSGIENIIMNGILMGSRRDEIQKKANEIITFSELGEFIYQPLRTYSSGMQMRLGFAVAVHIDPEILLIDEALAVGDLAFQEKCVLKMEEFKKSGTTIIIVSHDMTAIAKLCDRVAFVESGNIMKIGKPVKVIQEYLRHIGQLIPFDIGEDQTEDEADILLTANEKQSLDPAADFANTVSEPATPVGGQEILPLSVQPITWWDSLAIMRHCEEIITGDPDTDFYEFLKREYSIAKLPQGLSICTHLRGIEDNFIQYGNCMSFDVINTGEELENLAIELRNLGKNVYDLFLCIDLLSHLNALDVFLQDIGGVLKERGFIVAIEYIGPSCFQWTDKDMEIAQTICRALNGHDQVLTDRQQIIERRQFSSSRGMAAAVNSENVIPKLGAIFDVAAVRYFGGPLLDLVVNRILHTRKTEEGGDEKLIKTILQCEQILIKNDILHNYYAMIIGRKKYNHHA